MSDLGKEVGAHLRDKAFALGEEEACGGSIEEWVESRENTPPCTTIVLGATSIGGNAETLAELAEAQVLREFFENQKPQVAFGD